MSAEPSTPAGRVAVLASPFALIGACRAIQSATTPLGAWAWLPTMLAFWGAIAATIVWSRGSVPFASWLRGPARRSIWTPLALLVGLMSLREWLEGWHLLRSPGLLLLWLAYGLVNPWFEELYWRGLLLDAAGKARALGVVYSTAMFALSHPLIWGVHTPAMRHPAALVGLCLVGAVWALAYVRTRSLRFTIAGHACADLLGLAAPVLLNLHVPAALR